MFGVKVFADELERVVARYGIEVHKSSEVAAVHPEQHTVTITNNTDGTPRSWATTSCTWSRRSPPRTGSRPARWPTPTAPVGYVQVDKHTLQHTRYPNVFALGDAGSTPNSKTGAAIRKQAPVLVSNLLAAMDGRTLDRPATAATPPAR